MPSAKIEGLPAATAPQLADAWLLEGQVPAETSSFKMSKAQIAAALNLSLSGLLTLSGDDALIMRTTAASDVTFPTTGTLATLAGTETLSNKEFLAQDGANNNPSIAMVNSDNTGFYRSSANVWTWCAQTVDTLRFLSGRLDVAGAVSFAAVGGIGTLDTVLTRDGAAGALALRDTTRSMIFRTYQTFTDASNYERFAISQTAGAVTLAAQSAGTGTANRNIALLPAGTGNVSIFRPSADGVIVAPGAAGAGVTVSVLNNGITDFEPYVLNCETFTLGIRNGVGTVTTKLQANATGLGVFGVAPVARTAAYTQTYATATRTLAAQTATELTGTNGLSGFANGTEFNAFVADAEALRQDHLNLAQVVNSLIDDLQSYGWLQ